MFAVGVICYVRELSALKFKECPGRCENFLSDAFSRHSRAVRAVCFHCDDCLCQKKTLPTCAEAADAQLHALRNRYDKRAISS